MNRKATLLSALVLCFMLTLISIHPTYATEAPSAEDISAGTTYSGTGYSSFGFLSDKNDGPGSYHTSNGNAKITLENASGIGSLYLMFNLEYGNYTITDKQSGQSVTAGEHGFLHEYIDLKEAFGYAPTFVTLDFANGSVRLSEIYVFSPGTPPEFVQTWDAPLDGGADILLLASHGDDDQLFFAGLLPYYAGELDCRVQVAYLTDHRNLTSQRTHEMLNGLWAMGVDAYPIFGPFADFRIDSLTGTYNEYASMGITKDMLLEYVLQQIRRFKPQVLVGHDINGEYGHGMHRLYTDLMMQAVEISNDPAAYPELTSSYGIWDVPKTYIHLYKENPIVMDYDTPLEYFNGLTAFQATQKYGYPCHKTQQYTWFTQWLNGNNNEITKATQISTYSPCEFGLYRSNVGEDVAKNDFLENITTYAEQERQEAERLEQERLEAERKEQERLEAERKEQERLEAERKEQERLEAERKEQERIAQELRQRKLTVSFIILIGLILLLIILLCCIHQNNRNSRQRRQRQKNSL